MMKGEVMQPQSSAVVDDRQQFNRARSIVIPYFNIEYLDPGPTSITSVRPEINALCFIANRVPGPASKR